MTFYCFIISIRYGYPLTSSTSRVRTDYLSRSILNKKVPMVINNKIPTFWTEFRNYPFERFEREFVLATQIRKSNTAVQDRETGQHTVRVSMRKTNVFAMMVWTGSWMKYVHTNVWINHFVLPGTVWVRQQERPKSEQTLDSYCDTISKQIQ